MNLVHTLPLVFGCGDDALVGICHVPDGAPKCGVLVLVGGPQYRVGSHRQFVFLARALAGRGFAAMRFDFCGMGDSEGVEREFTDHGDEISAAIDEFFRVVPTLVKVVLWGLCDGASAALFYAAGDVRISGIILLNPWVRSEVGLAKARLKHYYLARFFDRQFWRKFFLGGVSVRRAYGELLDAARRSLSKSRPPVSSFQTRMAHGWRSFTGPILLILSGVDLTAKEFLAHAQTDPAWVGALDDARVARRDFDEADHTFSSAAWRERVENWCAEWIVEWIR